MSKTSAWSAGSVSVSLGRSWPDWPNSDRAIAGQAAKLAGLAPHRLRHIAYGPALDCRALYQAATVVAPPATTSTSRPFHPDRRARAKPDKLAYAAVARKFLVFLNRLLKYAPPLIV